MKTIAPKNEQAAYIRAAKHILSRIQNPDAPPQREIVPCSIIERESV